MSSSRGPLSRIEAWRGWRAWTRCPSQSGDQIGFVDDFPLQAGQTIEARVGISYISTDQARRNLQREIPEWNFDLVESNARAIWNNSLASIAVTGGTERQRTIFYTALLYRSVLRT